MKIRNGGIMIGIGTSIKETSLDMLFTACNKIYDTIYFEHKRDAMSSISSYTFYIHYRYPQNDAPLQWSLVRIKIFPFTLY